MKKITITSTTDNREVNNLTSKFEQIKGLWNIENTKKWNQVDTKALEIILEGLGSDDFILIDEYKTAAAI